METVTITFAITILLGALTVLCAFLASRNSSDVVSAACELSRRQPPQNVRVWTAPSWKLSRDHMEMFLTVSRAKAAQQGRDTRLHTLALNRMGAQS